MSILDRLKRGTLRQRALRAPTLERHASVHGALDTWTLSDLKRDAPVFRESLERPIPLGDGRTYEAAMDVREDLFLGAHSNGETQVKGREEMRPSHVFGRDVLDAFFKTQAHKDMKPFTEGDKLGSAIYAQTCAETFERAMLDEDVREQLENDQRTQEQEDQLGGIVEQLEGLRGEARGHHEGGDPIPQELIDEIKGLTGEREKLIEQLAGTPDPGPIPTSVGAIIEQAAADGQERVKVWGAIAGAGATDLEHITPDQAIALTEAWMQLPDFMELCKLLGRVNRDFRAQEARRIVGGSDEIIGIELGNNLTTTLPSEIARLGNPLTQRSFLRDYTDEALLQFQTQGSERVDNGPAILLLDLSGSMASASSSGRAKHIEAKSVAVGFVRLMHRKKRDAIVICFNGGIVWAHHFPQRGGIEMEQLLELAGLAPDGVTNITKAALRGEEFIKRMPAFKRADVVVITDGQAPYGPDAEQLRERFELAGVRKHGIAIGHEPAPGGWLLKFCEDAISVDDLTQATGDIVRAIS